MASSSSDSPRRIRRQSSFIRPEIHNPFFHELHLSVWDYVQVCIMSVTIAPIRLVLIAVFTTISFVIAYLATIGKQPGTSTVPIKGWRRSWFVDRLIQWPLRAAFAALGFHWVRVRGERSREPCVLVLAPHATFTDTLPALVVCMQAGMISPVGRAALPFWFKRLVDYTQPVYVHRDDPNSRQNTIREINRRAQSGGEWPQILIFPEGTTTNGQCLISFKPGAFNPGVPVQPVLIRYPNRLKTTIWTWQGPGGLACLWLTLCQPYTSCEIEFLPVYEPSAAERADPFLFASNVRQCMADALGIPVTEHSYEDIRLMQFASRQRLPMATGLVEFQRLRRKLGLRLDNAGELIGRFSKIDRHRLGRISLADFAHYLGLPVSPPLEELFSYYDRDQTGYIDFRNYLIGLSLVSSPANNEQTIQMAFNLFDRSGDGFISEEGLAEILQGTFQMSRAQSSRLFHQVDCKRDGRITYDEFVAYAKEKPEYAKLFLTYRQIREQALAEQRVPTDNHIQSTTSAARRERSADAHVTADSQSAAATAAAEVNDSSSSSAAAAGGLRERSAATAAANSQAVSPS